MQGLFFLSRNKNTPSFLPFYSGRDYWAQRPNVWNRIRGTLFKILLSCIPQVLFGIILLTEPPWWLSWSRIHLQTTHNIGIMWFIFFILLVITIIFVMLILFHDKYQRQHFYLSEQFVIMDYRLQIIKGFHWSGGRPDSTVESLFNSLCDQIVKLYERRFGIVVFCCIRLASRDDQNRMYVTVGRSSHIVDEDRPYFPVTTEDNIYAVLNSNRNYRVVIYNDIDLSLERHEYPDNPRSREGHVIKPKSMLIAGIYSKGYTFSENESQEESIRPGNNDILGLLYIKCEKKNVFDGRHIDFTKTLADSISLAVR